ncbi:secretory subunit [Friedmanniomyces endolithicus]|nr:secretory subunit [Friedmanniomyces endolithicus]
MSSEYNYDADAQFFPFFVLTITALITLPLTYTLLRKPSDASSSKAARHIPSTYQPDNATIIDLQRAKQKRKEMRLKRMLTAGAGWLLMAYMAYLMAATARTAPTIWNPYDILDVSLSASEKQINSRYRRLSVTMHPDKRQPNPALNETAEMVNDEWVEIVKAYKSLTDEDVRNNYVMYGNPDGKQSTSFGIALPKLLVADGSGKYVLAFYGLLLGIGLPWLVGKWWYGMQNVTKERILVSTAGNMFKEYQERMDEGDVIGALSSAMEFKNILQGSKADSGLGALEKLLQASDSTVTGMMPKDKRKLFELDDPARRKTLALVWAYVSRLDLNDASLEADKYEIAPTALQMNEAFVSFCLAYGFTAPVLASYHLSQALVQAIPPGPTTRLPLLQLPHFTPAIIHAIESQTPTSGRKQHLSIQSFMALPAPHRRALALSSGLSPTHLLAAETLARQLPLLKPETAFFKVQGEKHLLPSSLVQFVIKARVIPPGTPASAIPPINPQDLLDPDPADGEKMIAAQKKEVEQHFPPLAHAPHLPRDRAPRWHIFLADNRQGKIAVPPFTFTSFDKAVLKQAAAVDEVGGGGGGGGAGGAGVWQPTFEVVTLQMQFQAPPQAGEYRFQMHGVCDGYVGFDWREEVVMVVEEAGAAGGEQGEGDEDEISEPEEDTIAGQMASLRGQPTADPNKPPRQPRPKKLIKKGEDEESDLESGTDEEDEDEDSETDTDTDSDVE